MAMLYKNNNIRMMIIVSWIIMAYVNEISNEKIIYRYNKAKILKKPFSGQKSTPEICKGYQWEGMIKIYL